MIRPWHLVILAVIVLCPTPLPIKADILDQTQLLTSNSGLTVEADGQIYQINEPANDMDLSYSIILDAPLEELDLPDAMAHMTKEEYIACTPWSHAHKDYRVTFRSDNSSVIAEIFNEEVVAGVHSFSFYRPVIMQKDHMLMVSPTSKGSFAETFPTQQRVTWEIKLTPYFDDQGSSQPKTLYTCRVAVYTYDRVLASLGRVQSFLYQHLVEETPHFAEAALRRRRHRFLFRR